MGKLILWAIKEEEPAGDVSTRGIVIDISDYSEGESQQPNGRRAMSTLHSPMAKLAAVNQKISRLGFPNSTDAEYSTKIASHVSDSTAPRMEAVSSV